MSLLTNKQLKTHRTVQLPMINAPTNTIDGGPHPLDLKIDFSKINLQTKQCFRNLEKSFFIFFNIAETSPCMNN